MLNSGLHLEQKKDIGEKIGEIHKVYSLINISASILIS